jgi:hypothetical protein
MIAAVALNQMADHFWHGFAPVAPSKVFGKTDVKSFRAELASRNANFGLVRDVAEAHKHVKLDRPTRAVTSAGQTTVCATTGWGQGGFGTGPYGGGSFVVVSLDNGQKQHLSRAVAEVVRMWEAMLL